MPASLSAVMVSFLLWTQAGKASSFFFSLGPPWIMAQKPSWIPPARYRPPLPPPRPREMPQQSFWSNLIRGVTGRFLSPITAKITKDRRPSARALEMVKDHQNSILREIERKLDIIEAQILAFPPAPDLEKLYAQIKKKEEEEGPSKLFLDAIALADVMVGLSSDIIGLVDDSIDAG